MVSKNGKATVTSQEEAVTHQATMEAFNQDAGQAWVAANPGIVRTVLTTYPYFGKTVLMSRDEFKAGKRASSYV